MWQTSEVPFELVANVFLASRGLFLHLSVLCRSEWELRWYLFSCFNCLLMADEGRRGLEVKPGSVGEKRADLHTPPVWCGSLLEATLLSYTLSCCRNHIGAICKSLHCCSSVLCGFVWKLPQRDNFPLVWIWLFLFPLIKSESISWSSQSKR